MAVFFSAIAISIKLSAIPILLIPCIIAVLQTYTKKIFDGRAYRTGADIVADTHCHQKYYFYRISHLSLYDC